MIKLNQPLDITLTFTDTAGATAARVRYRKPNGLVGYWVNGTDGVSISVNTTDGEVNCSLPSNLLDMVGIWLITSFITYTDKEYPGSTDSMVVYELDKQ